MLLRGERPMVTLRFTVLLLVVLTNTNVAGAAGKRGSEQRTVDCAITRQNCLAICPTWHPNGAPCVGQCEVAFIHCINAPDAAGRTLRGRSKVQVAPQLEQ